MEFMTERPGGNIHDIFGSFGSTDFLLGQSILPVVAWANGERAMRCISYPPPKQTVNGRRRKQRNLRGRELGK
jgi:hypothetical protein